MSGEGSIAETHDSPMRSRSRLLVFAVVAAGFIGLLPFLPPADDRLEWVRKYGGRESSYDIDWSSTGGPAVRVVDFSFASAQTELEKEARRRMVVGWDIGHRFSGDYENWAMTFTGKGREISFVRNLNWFERMLSKVSGRMIKGVPMTD
jgi:hypothetical protein